MVVYEAVYLDKMVNPLNDTQKFEKNSLKNDKILNFAIKKQKHVDNILKKMLHLIAYLKKQGDLLNQLGPGQV